MDDGHVEFAGGVEELDATSGDGFDGFGFELAGFALHVDDDGGGVLGARDLHEGFGSAAFDVGEGDGLGEVGFHGVLVGNEG